MGRRHRRLHPRTDEPTAAAPGSLGGWLLVWAETQIIAAGRRLARLDCVAANSRLRRYYTEHGYHEAGYRSFPNPAWRAVMRFEKQLIPTDHPGSAV